MICENKIRIMGKEVLEGITSKILSILGSSFVFTATSKLATTYVLYGSEFS